jgi:hypothetical protein
MSGLERWKENRIRQGIDRVHLKHTDASPSGAGLNGGNLQAWNGTSVLLLEQTPGTRAEKRIPNRREKNSVTLAHCTCRPFSCRSLGVLRAVRNPPMMPLSQPEVKDHYNDVDDFTCATRRSGH